MSKKQEEQKERKASRNLGILSICLFWTSWPAMVMAIIGLCIKKSETNRNRDITLNVIGLVLSTLYTIWVINVMMTAMSKVLGL